MTAPIALWVLSILEELEEKLGRMSNQDMGPLSSLVNYHDLASYDIDLKARTCSCR